MGAYGGTAGGGEAQSDAPAFRRAGPPEGSRTTVSPIAATTVTKTAHASTGAVITVAAVATARTATAGEKAARCFRRRRGDQGSRARMALAPDLPPSPPLRPDGAAPRNRASACVPRRAGGDRSLWLRVDSTPGPQAAVTASPGLQTVAGSDQPDPPPASEEHGGMSPAVFTPSVSPSTGEPGISRATKGDLSRRLPTDAWPQPDRRGDSAPSPVSPTTGTAVSSPAAGPQRPAAPARSELSDRPVGDRPGPRGGGNAHLPRPDLSRQRRRRLGTPRVSRRAAEAGDAQAALALGGTYDPLVLKSLGVIGVAGLMRRRRASWYQKAAELGSREAPQRIDQLAQGCAESSSVPESAGVGRELNQRAGHCWSSATVHNARANTSAPAGATCPARNRGPMCRTAGSAAAGRASSSRRPKSRGRQRPHRHIASRSADAGSSTRSAARA